MEKKNRMNNADKYIRWAAVALIIYLISLMMIGLAGCSTLKKTFSESSTDSTSARQVKTDSSGTKNTKEVYTKETSTIYRDSIIFVEGKPYPVYMPTQTIIKEVGQKQVAETADKTENKKEETQLKKETETREKEKTGIPFTTMLIFGLLAIVCMGIVGIIIYLKVKP